MLDLSVFVGKVRRLAELVPGSDTALERAWNDGHGFIAAVRGYLDNRNSEVRDIATHIIHAAEQLGFN